jgi:hypothetical protein
MLLKPACLENWRTESVKSSVPRLSPLYGKACSWLLQKKLIHGILFTRYFLDLVNEYISRLPLVFVNASTIVASINGWNPCLPGI